MLAIRDLGCSYASLLFFIFLNLVFNLLVPNLSYWCAKWPHNMK